MEFSVAPAEDRREDIVTRVRAAVANPKWDFRTIDGIARETGLARDQVARVLAEREDLFRKSYLQHDGQPLYTLRGKPETIRERFAEVRDFLASPVTYRR